MKKPARTRPSAGRSTASGPPGTGTPGQGALGKVRLIGGHWRGTRLNVPDAPGLRPTADRVRETLFNWLAPMLPGALVLDLFAGSGALGLEALSRGAKGAVLVEHDRALASALRDLTAKLPGGEAANIVQSDALAWLAAQPNAGADPADFDPAGFDLVFLDPPFADGLWDAALAAVLPKLAADAWLYIEAPPELVPILPMEWALHREARTRNVRYALYRRRPGPADTLATPAAGD